MMGQIVVDMFVTLDGVFQAPGQPDEDLDGGFAYGGWQVPHLDAPSGAVIADHLRRLDGVLLGRRTYDIFAAYWPFAPDDHPIANVLNHAPKYVVSRTLQAASWEHTTVVRELDHIVPRLQEQHREVHVIGSGELVQSLFRLRVVDLLNLWLYPVVVGDGKRLFPQDGSPAAMELTSSTTFPNGTVLLTYRPGGAPTVGTMALDADEQPQQ